MSCTYTHSDLKDQTFDSMEDLINNLIMQNRNFYSAFEVAYDFDKSAATKENAGAKSFTNWYKEIMNDTSKFTGSFQAERGTFVHNYLSNRLKGGSEIFTEEEKNNIEAIIKKWGLPDEDAFKNISTWQKICSTCLDEIKQKIDGAELILMEEKIYYKKDDFENVFAIPDLVFKKGDTYYVVDYKITSGDIENNQSYVAQLDFIENILKKHGAEKVEKLNYVINPAENGHVKEANVNKKTFNVTIQSALNKIFSNKKNENIKISEEKVSKFETIKEKIENKRSSISTDFNTFKEYLQSSVTDYKKTYYNNSIYEYNIDGSGKITLTRKHCEDITFKDFDAFAEASWNQRQGKYQDSIDAWLSYLEEGQFVQSLDNFDEEIKNALTINLGKYNRGWAIKRLGNLTTKYGIVAMIKGNTCDLIKLSNVERFEFNLGTHSNGLFSKAINDKIKEGGNLLLNNLLPAEIFTQYEQQTPEANLGNIELFELFVASSLIKEELGDDIKIGCIEIISTINGSKVLTDSQQFTQFENAFKILTKHIDKSELESAEGLSFFTDYVRMSREETLLDEIVSILEPLGRTWSNYNIDTQSVAEKKQALRDLLEEIENNPIDGQLELTRVINSLFIQLENITPNHVFEEVNYGINPENLFGVWFDALFNDSIKLTNASGRSIPGLGGGLMHTASYQNPDEILRKTMTKRDVIVNGFVQKTIAETQELKNATERFLEWHNQNGFLGKFKNDEDIYKPLFQSTNGEIDQEMMFKDPYLQDVNNTLSGPQRDYLEVVLFTINKHRGLSLIKNLSLEQLKNSPETYQNYKDTISNNPEQYLTVPLKLKKGWRGSTNRLKNSWNKSDIKNWWKDTATNIMTITDPNVVTTKQLAEKRKALRKQKEIPSMYPPNTAKERKDLYEKHKPNEFILNLNYLAVDFVLDSLKRNELNQYLYTVKVVGQYLTFTEMATGIDLNKQREALVNDTTINVFLEDISEDEFKPLIAASNTVKKIQSYISLGFRPALFFKEELLGLIKNFSHSISRWIQSEHPITAKHIAQAYKIVIPSNWWEDGLKRTLGAKSRADYSMISLLNQRWRIHGHDLSMYSDQLTIHKTIWNFDSGLAYTNVTAPDNDNRMVIVVAKMLSDGTFNAFEIKNNQLVYNPTKDERFTYFFANRNNDKNMLNDKKYIQQKSLYEYYLTAFNDFGHSIAYSKNPKDWGMIPDPYTTKQISSLKEQIGMMYGFYNHEERDLAAFASWKRFYLQFMTWLPGELRRYFASGKESSVGKVAHLTDVEGKLLYWERLDDGTRVKTTKSTDENGNQLDPVYGWQDLPVVGLFTSMCKVLHHGIKGDFQWFKEPNHKYLIRNAGLCLFHIIFGMIISKILASLITDSKKHKEKYTKEAIMGIELGQKVFNELNFVNNVLSATESTNIVALKYMQNIFTDVSRSIQSDDYSLFDFLNDNVSVLKDLHIDD